MTDVRAYLKAQDFGVVGDGVTDDQPALNAMLAEFEPSNDPFLGGTILLPKGRFRLASPLEIKKNIRLVGAGAWATPLRCSSRTAPLPTPLTTS
jgi:polygalacturonase